MKQKDFRIFLNCESAISEIIAAIMLLAIAVGMIAMIQSESVPEWNKAIEMDHYNVVYDDFLKIRSDIEDVALFQFPKSSVIHMGVHYPERMIFINPAGTSGTITSNDVWINVTYTNSSGNYTYNNFSSTSIKFEPNYNYYSNAASLVYEHGLVIKDFTDSNYLYTDTSQGIISDNTINVLSLDYPLESVSFSDVNTMNYNPESIYSPQNITNVTVTFYTNYPLLWKELFKKYGLIYYTVSDTNILEFDYPYSGNITIRAYTVNGSIASGTGISIIPVLTTITVSPPTASVVVNNTMTFTAAPKDQSGATITAALTWTSSNTTVGTINATGVFTALAGGTTTITATSGIISANATATVVTEFNYVSDILELLNIGTVANFPAAKNASDGGASSSFVENNLTILTSNFTYVTSNADTSGTTTSFGSMQNGSDSSAYATLSEGAVVSSDIPTSPTKTIVNGTQSGSYSATYLNNNDGSIDVTNKNTINTGQTNTWTFDSNQESWISSYCCKTGSGTVTMAFQSGSGSPDQGSLEAEVSSSSSATQVTTFWNSTSFSWTGGTPETVSFDFQWRVANYGSASGSYWVNLIKPDGSIKTIKTSSSFSSTNSWSSKSDDALLSSDFSQNGNYRISLVARLATSSESSRTTTVRWDTPTLTLTRNRYSTDATYSFTQTKPKSSWVNITISDSSYAPAGTDVYIYNQTSSAWESIRTTDFTNGSSDSSHVNNKVLLNPSNYDTGSGVIKIKYEGIDLVSSSNIGLDLLQPIFYYNIYQMNISTTISSMPADLTYVLQTRYRRGNTNETGYNMDIWNYTSSSWASTQSLTADSWTQNNVTLTSGQISGGQVKTRFTDQTPTGTSPGNLSLDFQRINDNLSTLTYHLNITTNTSDIPDVDNHSLQLRYYVSGDSFRLQVWNGSYWNNRTTLTDTSLSYSNVTLLSDELIYDGTAGGSNKYYALIRYVDMDTDPTQQGTLYLDYQRIYNV